MGPDNLCRACGSSDNVLIRRCIKTSWFLCRKCLFFYKYPVLDIERDMVENTRYEHGSSYRNSEGSFLDGVRYKKILWQYFMKHLKPFCAKTVLDFGSGTGPLLEYLNGEGIEACGLEPSRKNAAFSISRGHKVVNGFIGDNTFAESSFDVIFLQNCGTFLVRPEEVFRILHKALKETGYIFWQDKQYHWSALHPERHFKDSGPVCYFSKPALYNLLSISGFEVISYRNIWGDFYLIARKAKGAGAMRGSYILERIWLWVMPVIDPALAFAYDALNLLKAPLRILLRKFNISYSSIR